jgi:HAD superfamily hydrolase (TIGR01549 family)
MSGLTYRGVVFDLDGTLIDTPAAIARITAEVLGERGVNVARETILAGVGHPLERNFVEYFGLPADDPEVVSAAAEYRRRFSEHVHAAGTSLLYPGVAEGLGKLREHGLLLAIATSKVQAAAKALVELTGIAEFFTAIAGDDSVPAGKPDPAMAHHAAALLGLPAEQCAVVGDGVADMGMARAAGMAALGVTYGVTDAAGLRTAGATELAESFGALVALLTGADQAAGPDGAQPLWQEEFDRFTTVPEYSGEPSGGRWAHVAGGGYVADDGVLTASAADGLWLRSGGVHPETGEPAFVQTIPQEGPGGLPGSGDHAKWIVYANHRAGTGFQGFDAVPGQILSGRAVVSGRVYGTAGHPFGDAVADPEDDLRLAGAMINTIDPETSMAFDFILTDKRLYAYYGRPGFARAQLGNYASFAHTIPLLDRKPEDWHDVEIRYDRAAGVVRWLVGGEEALRVDRIGYRLGRESLSLDEGGEEGLVTPRQLSFGMGLLSLLDGSWPTGKGLVRLSSAGTYCDPAVGEPAPQTFVDEESREGSRIFGQGAELRVRSYTVSTWPGPR